MEPAPFSAGNDWQSFHRRCDHDRFNGAGAFQRRKRGENDSVERVYDRSFNGAGAFQRRKLPAAAASPTTYPELQWSRRLSAPETLTWTTSCTATHPLQWSRRLSAPETTVQSVPIAGAYMLQWSRRLSAPETGRAYWNCGCGHMCFNGAGAFQRRKHAPPPAAGAIPPGASMEPAPFSAGNTPLTNELALAIQASMEPAPFSAGNVGHAREASSHPLGFNGAGAFQRRKPSGTPWGSRAHSCFNGAGAFQRRKLSRPWSVTHRDNVLQWSRRLSAPETPIYRCQPR